jgi:hypothetical protein
MNGTMVTLSVAFREAAGANSGDKAGAYLYFSVGLIAGLYAMWTVIPYTFSALRKGEVQTWGRGVVKRADKPVTFWLSIAMGFLYPTFALFCVYIIYALILAKP